MRGKSFGGERSSRIEYREEEPKGRELEVYLFRHGEAEGEGVDAGLTDQGREQAREAIEDLTEKIREQGGGIVKFLSSPTRRAEETREVMETTMQDLMADKEIKKIKLMKSRKRGALCAAGVIGPLKEQGIEDPIEHWLKNPDVLKDKTPSQVADRLKGLLSSLQKLADRLPSGEKIHYILVTHEVPQAALLNQCTGKTLKGLGGSIRNCELTRVSMKGKSSDGPKIYFRNEQISLPVS